MADAQRTLPTVPRKIRYLDLGGTACYEQPPTAERLAVIASLDGTTSDDNATPLVICNYNRAPFADNTFDEAVGACALETYLDYQELFRIMRPAAVVEVSSCDGYNLDDAVDRERFVRTIISVTFGAALAGFIVDVEPRSISTDETGFANTPNFILRKGPYAPHNPATGAPRTPFLN